jgi:hypothetical protein
MEELYTHGGKQRGVNSGNEVLHVLVVAIEVKASESREDSACERRWMSGFSESVGAKSRGLELKEK